MVLSTVDFPGFGELFSVPVSWFFDRIGCVFKDRVIIKVFRVRNTSSQSINECTCVVVQGASYHPCSTGIVFSFSRSFRIPCFVEVNGNRAFTTITVAMLFCRVSRRTSDLANYYATLRYRALRFFGRGRAFKVFRVPTSTCNDFACPRLLFISTEMKNIRRNVYFSDL